MVFCVLIHHNMRAGPIEHAFFSHTNNQHLLATIAAVEADSARQVDLGKGARGTGI